MRSRLLSGFTHAADDHRAPSVKLVNTLQEAYIRFRDQVRDPCNQDKLFVMIVDECHFGITANQAHDMIVNDFSWDDGENAQRSKCEKAGKPHATSGELLKQPNLVTILVSATPYNLLTNMSRLPHDFLVSDAQDQWLSADLGTLYAYDVFEKESDSDSWYSPHCDTRLSASQVQRLQKEKVRLCAMLHRDCHANYKAPGHGEKGGQDACHQLAPAMRLAQVRLRLCD